MLKAYGELNTKVTGTAGYSFVWGKTKIDEKTKKQVVWGVAKYTCKFVKKAIKFGTEGLPAIYSIK